MPIRSLRLLAAGLAAVGLAWAIPQTASAQPASSKKKTEGCMVSFDEAAGTLVVKDEKTKKEMTFNVKQATSVLDKEGTVATKNGRKAQLVDLEANRPLIVYWMQKDGSPFASKVDAPDPTDSETGQLDKDIMENFACKME